MYQKDLDLMFKKKKVPKALMLFGESHFLIDRYFISFKNYFSVDEIFTYYNFDYDFQSAKNSISQGSLFADKTMLVIKSEKKIPTIELQKLIKIVEDNDNSYFIYLYYGEYVKDINKAFLTTSRFSDFARFYNPTFETTQHIISQEILKRNFYISNEGILQLIYLKNSNLSIIISEIEKLSNYGNKNIGINEVSESVLPSGDIGTDVAISKFFNSGNYRQLLEFVDSQHIDEILLISYMIKFIEEIYLFRSAYERGDDSTSLSVLGRKLPPQIEVEKQKTAKRFNLMQVEKILIILMDTELKFKTGKVGDKSAFFIERIISMLL